MADVLVLLRGLHKFRQQFRTQTETTWPVQNRKQKKQSSSKRFKPHGCHPFRCLPLPRRYPHHIAPKQPARKQLGWIRLPTSPFLKRVWQHFDTSTLRRTSLRTFLTPSTFIHLLSIQWMEFLSDGRSTPILHARNSPNGREVKGCGRKVDGYCATTKTVFEFNGCYWHACPQCFPAKPRQRMHKQLEKETFLCSNGYTVISIWECAFQNLRQTAELKSFLEKTSSTHQETSPQCT